MSIEFRMDKRAIKQAAVNFRQALLDWKDKAKILEVFKQTRDSWTEEQLEITHQYETTRINGILEALDPILDLAIAGGIDEPFDFGGYAMSKVGRVFGDELSYPEIKKPYARMAEVLRGGLTHEEFWTTDYCKLRLMPKKFKAK